ncbi:ComEC/Rec2 family competence protein [Candidatus Wolfebacteria bacterium]|nr:ComEC/Rec2 family competence protein [Candidatus Wolfebacteria bacterium]
MKIYDVAFYASAFFLSGVFFASAGLNFSTIILINFFLAVILFFFFPPKSKKGYWLAGLSLIIVFGAFYYFWFNKDQLKNVKIITDQQMNFNGVVFKNPEAGDYQKLTVELQPPYSGKISVKLHSYPAFNYGDLLSFNGVIEKPTSQSYANYLVKDGIFGISDFPRAELIGRNKGSKIKAGLFELKEKIILGFEKTLPPENAAFLAGITIGERAQFSKEFKEAMNKSGTTHLVALSGYNISVIVMAVFGALNYFLSRRPAFILTVLTVIAFVLMTGAEASVVRAAIMGFILMLAGEVGRLYSFRNAVALAAFFMVLANPKILYFDIGFQLSFAALLGIIYLPPAIQKFFKMKDGVGFLNWRGNLLTTTSAQLAVAPMLIVYFNQFSVASLLANILILEAIPLTMFLGFVLAGIGFFSLSLAVVFSWFVNLLLNYETAMINLFSKFPTTITEAGFFWLIVYYAIIIFFAAYQRKPR